MKSVNNKIISVDPSYRSVQAWKTADEIQVVDQANILLQRVITSSIDVILHFDNKGHVTVIGIR